MTAQIIIIKFWVRHQESDDTYRIMTNPSTVNETDLEVQLPYVLDDGT